MNTMYAGTDGLRPAENNPSFIISWAEWGYGVVGNNVTVKDISVFTR